MGFKAEGMSQEKGALFREVCRSVAGLTGPAADSADSLLVSLPSEFLFNDLRDAGRRHSKAEKTLPHNLHCIAHKSATVRCAGGRSLEISSEDWSAGLKSKHVKSSVLHVQSDGQGAGCLRRRPHKAQMLHVHKAAYHVSKARADATPLQRLQQGDPL